MVAGDDRASAVAAARPFDDPRARCFWDADRTSGRTWGAFDRERLLPKILELLPAGSPEREALVNWDPEEQPLWDVAWFYAAEATWPPSGLPEPVAWSKQFAFRVGEIADGNGFFRGGPDEAGVAWSNWRQQFASGMAVERQALQGRSP